MPTTDRLQTVLEVGMIVNVPCVITALDQTTEPTVTLRTYLPDFSDAADTELGPIDAIQVIAQTQVCHEFT